MPDDLTPHARARAALAQAQGDTEYGKGIPQERVRVELDEGALLAAVAVQIEAAVLEATTPLREFAQLLVTAQEFAQMTPIPPSGSEAWSLGWWMPDEFRGNRFRAVLSLDREHFDRARAVLQEQPR